MHIILTIHIILLSLSLVTTATLVVTSLLSKTVSMRLIRLNYVGTLIGLTCGGLLLLARPIGSECLLLLSYLVVFNAAHLYIWHTQKTLPATLGISQ